MISIADDEIASDSINANGDNVNIASLIEEVKPNRRSLLERWRQFRQNRPYRVLCLCLFAFFYIANPAQPFLVEFLMVHKSMTLDTILTSIFPVWTYSMLVVQLLIGVLSELRIVGHKWMIASGVFLHMIELYVTLFCSGPHRLLWLQLGEVIVAWTVSCYQSYFALRYHMTDKTDYHLITGLTRASMLLGNVAGALIGQTIYLLQWEMYLLYYASILCAVPCLLIAVIVFPSPNQYIVSMDQKPTLLRSAMSVNQENESTATQATLEDNVSIPDERIPLNHNSNNGNSNIGHNDHKPQKSEVEQRVGTWTRLKKLPSQILSCYLSSFQVSFWSVFGFVSVAIHSLSLTYYQTLFKTLDSERSFNGFLMAGTYPFVSSIGICPQFRLMKCIDSHTH